MNTPQRIFYGSIESGTMWDSEKQAKAYHFQAHYFDFSIIEMVERTPVIAAAPELLEALQKLHSYTRSIDSAYGNGLNDTEKLYLQVHDAICKALGQSA